MRVAASALLFFALTCIPASGQSRHEVWVCDTFDGSDCHMVDSSVMGGVRYEDYKVTSPAAVQFDPAQRVKQLAALGTSTADTLCDAPPTFTTPAPTITFDKTTVAGNIYWVPVGPTDNAPYEFMDVRFSNFTASNGFSSPQFGFRMIRQLALDGSEIPQYSIFVQAGDPGLQNVSGLFGNGTGFEIDPAGQSATFIGAMPASALLRDAILGVLVNAQSILSAANFTVTNPAPAGKTLWNAGELITLAGQAQPLILPATSTNVPIGPPYTCSATSETGYGTCNGSAEIAAFNSMILGQGGEYLGLRTQQSFNILVSNLRTWATANAPSADPGWLASNASAFTAVKWDMAFPILNIWPTLRADPALSAADQQTIDNWIVNWLVPPFPGTSAAQPVIPGSPDYWPNDLGYWADANLMADAIRRSDHATFAFGIQRFYGALNQMLPDGSFPLVSELSACSATYSNAVLIHLTSIAEMAATQGYDLYSMSVNGKSFETAIEFLLNAYQDPGLLYQYSILGQGGCFEGNPGDPPDFSLVFGPGKLSTNLTWAEPYIARFPLSTTAARLRTILGSNVNASPFPLMVDRNGLNTTCAFRSLNEFQPVNGANVTIVSGNNQTAAVDQALLSPVSILVTDNSGKALAGQLASFAVVEGSANVAEPSQLLTDANGMASAAITMGPVSGPVAVTAKALGVGAGFSLTVPGPATFTGGVVGIGASVPAVTAISPGALFSIYGEKFVPANSGGTVTSSQLVNGVFPASLFGVCVTVGGANAPLLGVYPGQINAVAPNNIVTSGLPVNATAPYTGIIGSTEVVVITGCGTAGAAQSMPQMVAVQTAAPEFLYFAHNANGQNPVAAINAVTGAYVGPASLGTSFAPAQPGDILSIFASGFGPTNPAVAPGTFASGAAPATNPVTVTLGSVTLPASDVLYAGAAPGELISQLNIRIPAGTPAGNLPLQIQVAGMSSPPGAFLAIGPPSN
jgi:uncharacterized protein (TIGR03437 family)